MSGAIQDIPVLYIEILLGACTLFGDFIAEFTEVFNHA